MRSLFAKIPRDRSLILLIAPLVALGALFVATRTSDPEPSTSDVAAREAAEDAAAEESAAGADTEVLAEPTEQSPGDVDGFTSDDSLTPLDSPGSLDSGTTDTGAGAGEDVPAWVEGSTSEQPAGTDTSTTAPPAGAPSTTMASPTTTVPVTTTTSPDSDPGPDPTIDESPLAVLLPLSAVVVTGLAAVVVLRRRRARADA